MWVFTEWADWFDRTRRANDKQIDAWLQPWVATTLQDDSPWYRNALIYTAAGAAYAANKLSTQVAAGFVDVARVGDGVQKGGWGYGEDALRLLILAGPILRVARYGLSLVAAVDEINIGNCGWVAATRALRLTGTRHYARIGDLAKAAGLADVSATGGISDVSKLLPWMTDLGADARVAAAPSTMADVANLARANPNGVVMFGVRWSGRGHVLLATRGPAGIVRIIDRTGDVVSELAELDYAGIGAATPSGGAVVVQNARIVTLLNNAPLLLNELAVEVRSAPVSITASNEPVVILKTDSQLLSGWWWVWVSQWVWVYDFDPGGGVRWTDPYNLKTGKGSWKATSEGVSVSWAPASRTTEQWNLPIQTGNEIGTCRMQSGTFPLKAMKVPSDYIQQLVGRWAVRVDKWSWIYEFDDHGGVRWTDPSNKMTGNGWWTLTKDRIYISWAPASRTTELWDQPVRTANETGTCRMQSGTFPLKADRM